jgi:uncharacterized repeat protein (TIGR02543 family)
MDVAGQVPYTGQVYNSSTATMKGTTQIEVATLQTFQVSASGNTPVTNIQINSAVTNPVSVDKGGSASVSWAISDHYLLDTVKVNDQDVTASVQNNTLSLSDIRANQSVVITAAPETYPITYVLNGGENASDNPSSYAYGVGVASFADPTRDGYTFGGWYGNKNLSGEAVTSISTTATGAVTLYAKWTRIPAPSSQPSPQPSPAPSPEPTPEPSPEPSVIPTPAPSTPPTVGDDYDYTPSTPAPTPGSGSDDDAPLVDIEDEDVPLAGDANLNDVDHFAYIVGYTDGTVRPLANITRQEVAVIFYRLLDDTSRAIYYAEENSFSDVDSSWWSNTAISTLANIGVITGYTDGTFRPLENISREEFAAIAARFAVVTETPENPFSDTEGRWSTNLISFAYSKGWVTGYTDGTFRPTENITRAETMAIINRVLDRKVDETGLIPGYKSFSDNTDALAWYYYDVIEATNSHDYERQIPGEVLENWTALTEGKTWN